MRAEFNKYYLLDNEKFYFSVDLQRHIKFNGKLAVKCDSEIREGLHYGILIAISDIYDDYITKNEIIFSDSDVISEYTLKDMPLLYMDFKYE